jgi:2-methylcitrate dehydratase PrpD
VKLLVPPFAERIASFHAPETGEQAKFSLEQAVAGVLVDGVPEVPYIAPFTDAGSKDARYIAARDRVDVQINGLLPNQRGFAVQEVTVVTKEGTSFTMSVDRLEVPGREKNALSTDDRIAAFHKTAGSIDHDKAKRLVDVIMDLENHAVSDIAEILVPR